MGETNNKKYQYDLKYRKAHVKRVPLDMRKEDYEKLLTVAKQNNLAVNTFIKQAINEKIERLQPQSKEWYGYSVFRQSQEQQNQQPNQDQQNQQAPLETDDDYRLPWETE